MLPIWLDPEGGLKAETREQIAGLSSDEASVLAQHPHWSGAFSLDDMDEEDLDDVSAACLEHDSKLAELYDRLVPATISQDTFWTSYLSHVEYYLSNDLDGKGPDPKQATPRRLSLASRRATPATGEGGGARGRTPKTPSTTPNAKAQPPLASPSPAPVKKLMSALNAAASALEKHSVSPDEDVTGAVGPRAAVGPRVGPAKASSLASESVAASVEQLTERRLGGGDAKRGRGPMPTPAAARSGGGGAVLSGGARVHCPKVPVACYVAVYQAGVNIRNGPSLEHDSVGSVAHGEALVVWEQRDRWIRHSDGWSCTQMGGFTLLERIPMVTTPVGWGYLCHRDGSGLCKVRMCYGSYAYIVQQKVVPFIGGRLQDLRSPAFAVSRAVEMSKGVVDQPDSDPGAPPVRESQPAAKRMVHTGLVVGLLQALGVAD